MRMAQLIHPDPLRYTLSIYYANETHTVEVDISAMVDCNVNNHVISTQRYIARSCVEC